MTGEPVIATSPSIPPRGMTWPMVAYAFVRELPFTSMVVGGTVLAVVFVFRAPGSALEPLTALIGPSIVSALGRSKPPDDGARFGGLMALVGMLTGRHL